MIGAIAKTLRQVPSAPDDTPICVVEGPPGTGKTLGIMASAIPAGLHFRKKVVISTANVGLQEQIINRDLPQFRDASGCQFEFALAKGRSRYACPKKLMESTDPAALPLQVAFRAGEWNGERDTLRADEQVDADTWATVITDSQACTGGHCSYNKAGECPYYRARDRVAKADVIVCNHDLLLSCAHAGVGILPDLADTIVVLDEAHHIPRKAQSRTATSFGLRAIDYLVGQIQQAIPPKTRTGRQIKGLLDDIITLNNTIKETAASFRFKPEGKGDIHICRLRPGIVPEGLASPGREISQRLRDVQAILGREADQLKGVSLRNPANVSAARDVETFNDMASRAGRIASGWEAVCESDAEDAPPKAKWLEYSQGNDNEREIRICSSLIIPGEYLKRVLWDKVAAAVVTSATLRTLGNFDRFNETSGLGLCSNTRYLELDSPFDYQNNAVLEVPDLGQTPKDKGYDESVASWLNQHMDTSQGGLVLFTSYTRMKAVLNGMNPALRNAILVQGELPKAEMIAKHKERIEASEGSWLFGVDSLAEGLDLPGDLLRHVVITSLPFPVPTSPAQKALNEYLESVGRNPFTEVFVPDCSEKLVQMVGRLIRTSRDSGKVTILDTRIKTKRYGRTLLMDLPDMKRVV